MLLIPTAAKNFPKNFLTHPGGSYRIICSGLEAWLFAEIIILIIRSQHFFCKCFIPTTFLLNNKYKFNKKKMNSENY